MSVADHPSDTLNNNQRLVGATMAVFAVSQRDAGQISRKYRHITDPKMKREAASPRSFMPSTPKT